MRRNLAAAVAALCVAGVASSTAGAVDLRIEPYSYASGYVTAVDRLNSTLVVDGRNYSVRPSDLNQIQAGAEIDIWFDHNTSRVAAIAVRSTDNLMS